MELTKIVSEMESKGISQEVINQVSMYHSEARTDTLTGLQNKRAFEEQVSQASYIIAFDINGFKTYQDNHPQGHQAGDEVLKGIAQVVNQYTRSQDVKGFRQGGDEYAVFLVGVNEQETAIAVAERLSTEVRNKVGLTISVGIGRTYEQADANSYQAKRQYKATGLNQVIYGGN